MRDEEHHPQRSQKWLEDMSKGIVSHELEALTHQGLQIELAQKGLIRCKFVVPEHLSVIISPQTSLNLISLLNCLTNYQ